MRQIGSGRDIVPKQFPSHQPKWPIVSCGSIPKFRSQPLGWSRGTCLLELYPPDELDGSLQLISRRLVPWFDVQRLFEIRDGIPRPKNGEIRCSSSVVGFSI